MNKRILVTGGSGFLGTYILRYLLKEGFSDITATRSSANTSIPSDLQVGIKWIEFPMPDREAAFEITKEKDCIIHSAAYVSYMRKDKAKMISINRDATAELIDASLANNIDSFIYISSIATLGKPENSKVMNESSPWEENEESTPYGLSKYLGELEAWRGAAEGLKVAAVLPSVILGSGPGYNSSLQLIEQIKGPLGMYPGGTSGFVDVRDVARFTVELVRQEKFGDRWLLKGHTLTYGQVYEKLGRAMGLNKQFRRPPKWALKYFYGTYRSIIGKGLSKEMVNQMYGDYEYESVKSLSLPGFTYTPIETTAHDIGQAYSKAETPGFLPV